MTGPRARMIGSAAICAAALAGCGGGGGGGGDEKAAQGAGCVSATPSNPTRVSFRVTGSASAAELATTRDLLCDRLKALGAAGTVVPGGNQRIDVAVGGANASTAAALVGVPGRLAFYDWEPSLVQPQPLPTRAAAQKLADKSGAVVVAGREKGSGYYVVRDDPALTNADIRDPKQDVDPATSQPEVSFDFTPAGAKKFEALTASVAKRGAKQPGHIAIVFDGQTVSLPIIDASQSPNGLSADNGAVISGIQLAEAKSLAAILSVQPLPVTLAK